jgi:hypothetical protein
VKFSNYFFHKYKKTNSGWPPKSFRRAHKFCDSRYREFTFKPKQKEDIEQLQFFVLYETKRSPVPKAGRSHLRPLIFVL